MRPFRLCAGWRVPRIMTVPVLLAAVAQAQPIQWVDKRTSLGDAYSATVFDVARGRAVRLPGTGDNRGTKHVWEWDGERWHQRGRGPDWFIARSAAHDPHARLTYAVGPAVIYIQVWAYDGVAWVGVPSPLTFSHESGDFGVAYDESRQRLVFVGSAANRTAAGYVWEWDGSRWSPQLSNGFGGGYRSFAVGYHAGRRRVVAHARFESQSVDGRTWEWDGRTWSPLPSTNHAPASYYDVLAWDSVRQRLLLLTADSPSDRLWEWDGVRWSQLVSAPRCRVGASMVFDPVRRATLVIGGYDCSLTGLPIAADTWSWDGATWNQVDRWPMARTRLGLASDGLRSRVVLFGGEANLLVLADTWEWDGARWHDRTPAVSPTRRAGHALAWHAASSRVLLYGGTVGGTALGDTWEWDGQVWTVRAVANPPAPRSGHALAYDSRRARTVLFGGLGTTLHSDTWEWDGSAWNTTAAARSPSPRYDHAMAFDASRGVMVLYGGRETPNKLHTDTWEWNGIVWRNVNPGTPSPGPRAGHAMGYDAARQRVVLVGGGVLDAWEFDGRAWTAVGGTAPGGTIEGAGLAPDATRGRLLSFGGGPYQVSLSRETWVFGDTTPAGAATYGSPCGALAPRLTAFGVPSLGENRFALDVRLTPTAAPVAVVLSLGRASLPFGPCTVLVDPSGVLATVVGTTNGAGFVALPLPIPPSPRFIGAAFFAQALVVDGSGPFPFALSGGLALTVGD